MDVAVHNRDGTMLMDLLPGNLLVINTSSPASHTVRTSDRKSWLVDSHMYLGDDLERDSVCFVVTVATPAKDKTYYTLCYVVTPERVVWAWANKLEVVCDTW
jgi:hypothetical protein